MQISFIQKIIGFSFLSVGSVLTIVLPIVLKKNNTETKIDNIDIETEEVQGESDDYIYLYATVRTIESDFSSLQIDQKNKNFQCLFGESEVRKNPFDCEISKLKDNENKIHTLGKIESLKNYTVVASDLSLGKMFQIKIKTSDFQWNKIFAENTEYIDIISTTDQRKKYLQFHQIFATYKDQKKLIFNHIIARLSSVEAEIKDYSDKNTNKWVYNYFECSFISEYNAKHEKSTGQHTIYNWSDQDASKLENYKKSSRIDIKKGNFYIINPDNNTAYYKISYIGNNKNLYAKQQPTEKVATFTDLKLAFLSNAYDHIFILT